MTGLALYASAVGATLFVRVLIMIMSRDKYEDSSAYSVTAIVLGDFVILSLFSVLWITFVEVYKALG